MVTAAETKHSAEKGGLFKSNEARYLPRPAGGKKEKKIKDSR